MKNKNILITGGCFGLGRSLTEFLAKENHTVIVLDKDKDELQNLENEFSNVKAFYVDLSDFSQVREIADSINEKFKINMLINNAAIQYVEDISSLDFKHWDIVQTVNLKTPMYLMKVFGLKMTTGDKILNITSVHGTSPRLNKYAYDSSKAAMNLMTKEIALSFAKKGVLVNAVAIGATKTRMNDDFKNNELLANSIKKIPLKRVYNPAELIPFVEYLLFKDNYSTGSIFTIDGGRSIYNS